MAVAYDTADLIMWLVHWLSTHDLDDVACRRNFPRAWLFRLIVSGALLQSSYSE